MDPTPTGTVGSAGDFSTATGIDATDLGYAAEDGTDLGNPEVTTEGFFVGDASTGATYTATIRILGGTVNALVSAAAVAHPPTLEYLFLPNISLTRFTQIKGYCTEPFVEPATGPGKRTSWGFTFTAKGDAVSDFHTHYTDTIIVPG